ncbi:MAG TPA: amidohydrolase family protein [Terriglobales bacterium]|nr:amidohydrolase family protein [Terriglobales bacterium]
MKHFCRCVRDRILVRLFLLALLWVASGAAAQVTVIKAGRLVDTASGTILNHQIILIRDGRIEAVGGSVNIPSDAKVIDLSRMTVLPGLIDCHTHLVDSYDEADPLGELERTAAQDAFQSIPHAKAVLLAGFTTVRDMGTYRALVDVALRDAIARGDVAGPRMFVAGAYVTITGGAGAVTGFAPDISLPWDLHYGEANSPWEVRQRVRALAHQRVDVIKVLATGAVLTHNSNLKSQEFTPEELRAAVEEASSFGLKVAAHAHSAEGIKNAVRAGVASIEHGSMLDAEGIQLMKQHGTFLVPTLEVHDCIQAAGHEPPDFVEHDRNLAQIQRANFRKAVEAGVKVAFGTDISVCPFGSNGKEFKLMVDNGMSPMQAIQAATVGAADLIGASEQIGSIRPGKSADVIAVEGDPLQDVKVLEQMKFVMKEGVVYKQ